MSHREKKDEEREGKTTVSGYGGRGGDDSKKLGSLPRYFLYGVFLICPGNGRKYIAGNCVYRYRIDAIFYRATGFASGSPLVRFIKPSSGVDFGF